MPKGKKYRKMPAWRRWARVGIGALGAAIGTLVATRPFHRGLQLMFSGNFAGGVEAIGYDIGAPGVGRPANQPDVGAMIGVGITAAVGIGIFSLFRYIARRV